ncbi:MAG: hypothetical protein ABJF01_06260 [bacterium]
MTEPATPPTMRSVSGFGAIPPDVLPFKAASCVFDLCQFQSYISIKDQMLRAHMIAAWLHSSGVLGHGVDRVLVVGGGVAGVCAAALIAEYGATTSGSVEVTLVDERSDLFSAQEACDTRYVSLTQFDWPAAHYDVHAWPNANDIFQANVTSGKTSFRLTVPQRPTRASDLVKQWRQDFAAWNGTTPVKVQWKPRTTAKLPLTPPTHAPATVRMTSEASALESHHEFDLVIMAGGFSRETIPKIAGVKIGKEFWEHDEYANPAANHAGKDFAIVGNGDGALQDFLRLLCHPHVKSASAIVDHIRSQFLLPAHVVAPWLSAYSHHGASPLFPTQGQVVATNIPQQEAWLRLLSDLADIDRQSALAAPWDSHSTRGMDDLQADVELVVRRFASNHAGFLVPAIDSVLRQPADALGSITLIARNESPTKCYMLNRFLFTLIKWRLTSGPATRPLPRCAFIQESVDVSQLSARGGRYHLSLSEPVHFDELIWRVGIGPARPVSMVDGLRVAIGRHALPFYPPDRFRR